MAITTTAHNNDFPQQERFAASLQRARVASSYGFSQTLLSEVVAELPGLTCATLWRAKDDHLFFWRSTKPDMEYKEFCRKHVEQRRALGIALITPTEAKLEQFEDFPRVVAAGGHTAALISISYSTNPLVLELHGPSRAFPKENDSLSRLRDLCVYFGELHTRSDTRFRESSKKDSLGEAFSSTRWSLRDIQNHLLRRLRPHLTDLQGLHLFLVDATDGKLYFADSEDLWFSERVLKSRKIPWTLSAIRSDYQKHIQTRIEALAGEIGQERARRLGTLYDTLLTSGLCLQDLRDAETDLRLLLRCLPQEPIHGVAGLCFRSGVLTTGGEDLWNDPGDQAFFTQKLELEQLFGVAFEGFVTAVPVHDGPQVIGCLFISMEFEPKRLDAHELLNTSLEASALLTQFRTTAFVSGVLASLEHAPNSDFHSVVEEHLGVLISYEMMIVVERPSEISYPSIVYARYRSQLEMKVDSKSEITRSPALNAIVASLANKCVAPISADMWNDDACHVLLRDTPLTAIRIPFDQRFDFILLVAETEDQWLWAMDSLQQKLAQVSMVSRLRDAYTQRFESEQHHNWLAFASHSLRRRFCDTIGVLQKRLDSSLNAVLTSLSNGTDAALSLEQCLDLVDELHVVKEIMDSQFTMIGQNESRRPITSIVYVEHLLENKVQRFIRALLRMHEYTNGAPYTANVQIDFKGSELLPVCAYEPDLTIAFVGILENALKEYAISRAFVRDANHDRTKLSITSYRRGGDAVVEIFDTGKGMQSEFMRIYNATFADIANGRVVTASDLPRQRLASEGAGTGIGLLHAPSVFACVRSIDGQSRGKMRVMAREPYGTVFEVSLPLASEFLRTEDMNE